MADYFNLELSNGTIYQYQVITSKRAKYIRIRITREGILKVNLPTNTNIKYAHDFVASKRLWIEKNLKSILINTKPLFPEELDLLLLGEIWSIEYEETFIPSITLKETESCTLQISGGSELINDVTVVTKLLNQWCRKKAIKQFNLLLQEQAELYGFHYKRLCIRAQKTRWGSCSHQKNINLNCKLLFMPLDVVKYVMIHELCHTIEMNHSSRFWELVKECDPNYYEHKKRLNKLSNTVPI